MRAAESRRDRLRASAAPADKTAAGRRVGRLQSRAASGGCRGVGDRTPNARSAGLRSRCGTDLLQEPEPVHHLPVPGDPGLADLVQSLPVEREPPSRGGEPRGDHRTGCPRRASAPQPARRSPPRRPRGTRDRGRPSGSRPPVEVGAQRGPYPACPFAARLVGDPPIHEPTQRPDD